MRDLIKITYFNFLDLIGENKVALNHKWPSVTILTYHSVLPDEAALGAYENRNAVSVSAFDRQLQMLQQIFKIIPLSEAYALLKSGNLNDNYAVITFDDGYKNNFDFAFPVLKKRGLSATFFITTALIETDNCLWTDWVTYLFFRTAEKQLELAFKDRHFQFKLRSYEERIKASETLRKFMKSLKREEADGLLNQLKMKTKVESHPVQEAPERYAFMRWSQVRQMAEQGMEIGSHTHSHSLLSMLSLREAEKELQTSAALIEEKTGRPCRFFAYPNGTPADFTDEHINMLRALNFKMALTQIPGYNQAGADLFRLKRINITSQMQLPVFKAYVCGSRKSKYHELY